MRSLADILLEIHTAALDTVRRPEIGSEAWLQQQLALGLNPEEHDRAKP